MVETKTTKDESKLWLVCLLIGVLLGGMASGAALVGIITATQTIKWTCHA